MAARKKVSSHPPVTLMSPWVVHVPGQSRTMKCTVCGQERTVKVEDPRPTGIEELRWIAAYNEQVEEMIEDHALCGQKGDE